MGCVIKNNRSIFKRVRIKDKLIIKLSLYILFGFAILYSLLSNLIELFSVIFLLGSDKGLWYYISLYVLTTILGALIYSLCTLKKQTKRLKKVIKYLS